jgi:hypothetical protein
VTKARRFWEWFVRNEPRLRVRQKPRDEALLDEVLNQLHEYCDQLWFEYGGMPEGPHEFIISAGGHVEFFAAARRLVAAAPDIPNWRFIALKPASGFDFVTEYQELLLDPGKMWFLPLKSGSNPDDLGLLITGPAHAEASRRDFLAACWVVLDCGLGEQAAAENIQHLEVGPMPDDPPANGYIELHDLKEYIEWRTRRKGSRKFRARKS